MNDNLFNLRKELDESEEHFNKLNKKMADMPSAYEECQRAIHQLRELWVRALYFSKGTVAEKQVYQKLDELEGKQRRFSESFSIANETIEQELRQRKVDFENAEKEYINYRKELADEDHV